MTEEKSLMEMLRENDDERYKGEFVPLQGRREIKKHTPAEYDPDWTPGGNEEGNYMTMSNIWATDKYRQKLELVFEGLNIFEVNAFFEKHRFADFDEATEDNVQDHDVWLIDEASYETFIDHLDNYFTRGD